MRILNGWLATTLIAIATALIGFLVEMPHDWFSVQFPLPIVNGAYDRIFLADFAYFGFLSSTAYWLALSRFGKARPSRQNPSGILLGAAVAIFAVVALDFLLNFLPKSSECHSMSLESGIAMRQCAYASSFRNWLAFAGAACLSGSLIASMRSKVIPDVEVTEAIQ